MLQFVKVELKEGQAYLRTERGDLWRVKIDGLGEMLLVERLERDNMSAVRAIEQKHENT